MAVVEIASAFNTTPTTVQKFRTSYVNNGLEATCFQFSMKSYGIIQPKRNFKHFYLRDEIFLVLVTSKYLNIYNRMQMF